MVLDSNIHVRHDSHVTYKQLHMPQDRTNLKALLVHVSTLPLPLSHPYTVAPPHSQGIWSKIPSGCLKLQMAPNPIYTILFPINIYCSS